MRKLVLILSLTIALPAHAQLVHQGRSGKDPWKMDPSVSTTISQGHFMPGVAVTTMKSSLAMWRSFYTRNSSNYNCCFTFDASNPATTATGCTNGTPLPSGEQLSRDYGLPYPVKVACSGQTTAGADIAYELVK